MLQEYCSISIDQQYACHIAGNACCYKFTTGNAVLLRYESVQLILHKLSNGNIIAYCR